MRRSHGPDHFRKLYRASADPWDLASSPYEAAKYQHTLRMLGQRDFAAGLEVGCSIGVLTRHLASHCDGLLAVDMMKEPLRSARGHCADLPRVRFARMQVPNEWPDNTFDLIVLSEVLYFLAPIDIRKCAAHTAASTRHNAIVLLVNWLGHADDPCSGDEAAEIFIRTLSKRFRVEQAERTERYRIDRLISAT